MAFAWGGDGLAAPYLGGDTLTDSLSLDELAPFCEHLLGEPCPPGLSGARQGPTPPPASLFQHGAAAALLGPFPAAAPAACAPALQAGAQHGAGEWRCLNTAHAQPCPSCAAPPCEDDEDAYEFVGDVGKKNGEKLLRSGISRTPEWADADECGRLASAAEARGTSGGLRLAVAIRSRRVAELRKSHILFLCRTWGYKSDLWRRRDARKDYRHTSAAPAADAPGEHTAGHFTPPQQETLALALALPQQRRAGTRKHPRRSESSSEDLVVAGAAAETSPRAPSSSALVSTSRQLTLAGTLHHALVTPLRVDVLQTRVIGSLYALSMESCRSFAEGLTLQMKFLAHMSQEVQSRVLAEKEGMLRAILWIDRYNGEALLATRKALPAADGAAEEEEHALACFTTRPAPLEQFFWALGGLLAGTRKNVQMMWRELLPMVPMHMRLEAEAFVQKCDDATRVGMLLTGQLQALHAQARLGTMSDYVQVAEHLSHVVHSYAVSCMPMYESSNTYLKACGAQSGMYQPRCMGSRLAALPVPTAERLLSAAVPTVLPSAELLPAGV